MGNPISDQIKVGTIGELLVQVRLLQFGVQAAPPLKDSGNDLIAVRGEAFRGVQVKTTAKNHLSWRNLPNHYHLLALVNLSGEGDQIFLDASQIYLVPRSDVAALSDLKGDFSKYRICQVLIDKLFKD
jgi:hypothetical protein